MDTEPDAEADPDSQRALLDKKQIRELKKINNAREKAHKRFEALLSIGSGSEDVSEKPTPATKKRQRTKTAEPGLSKLKKTPPKTKERSKSEEDLLSAPDNVADVSNSLRRKKSKKDGRDGVDSTVNVDKPKKKNKKSKRKPTEDGAENDAFEKGDDDGHDVETPTYDNNNDDDDVDDDDDDDDDVNNQVPTPDRRSYDEDDVHAPSRSNEQLIQEGEQVNTGKKKKHKKKKEKQLNEYIEKALQKKRHDDGLLLCIIIHKADQVKPDARVRHPLIRVHLVNMESGEYIKKTDRTRNVTSMHENKNETENIDYILPLLTQPYDFKTNRTLTPHWEEILVYNEIYSYFLQREPDDPPVIIFFELLDFMQMNLKQKEFAKTDKGWYRIAWAFLKVLSPSGSTNTDRQVRLQFYQPLRRVRAQKDDNSSLEIFRWWKYGHRIKYPSTLYITVKGVFPPERLKPTNRSMFPTQQERGAISYEELNSTLEETTGQREHDLTPPMWTRLPGQLNRIPNKLHLRLPSGRKGCTVVQFSNNGRYLACACASNDSYPILIYEFPEGQLISTYDNHFGIVYDLCWSANGKELLSASADSTVRCWDTKRFASSPIKLFPHPSFVYVCKYHIQLQSIVVTGAYDNKIRVWNKMSDHLQAILLREICEHEGFVNSITFNNDGSQFFSVDSVGVILEWSSPSEKKKKVDIGEVVNRWQLVNTIKLPELKNTTLNTIHMHPSDCKLLIHSRDSILRMLDLRSHAILKSYIGGMNFKEHIHSTLSTCGSFVFCGTEYGLVHVWSAETGNLVHTYTELEFTKAVSDVHFHPQDNYVVFCCYGDGHPIVVYAYDPKVNIEKGREVRGRSISLDQSNALSSLDNTTETFRSLRTATMIDNDEERLVQIKEKLMSVTAQSNKNRVTFKDLTPRNETNIESPLSTWGSDFTYTLQGSPSLSPSNQPSDIVYKRSGNVSSTPLKSSPNETLKDSTLTLSQLEVPSKRELAEKKRKESTPRTRKVKKVVAMYDYHPTETNQLAFSTNDVITIISKENADWWFGQLQDGRQGYFPITYVMQNECYEDKHSTAKSSKSVGNVSTSYSAVVDRHGELKFISGNEESDSATELQRSQKKRKQRRSRIDNPSA